MASSNNLFSIDPSEQVIDCIVVGLGSMGSSALFHLSKRGMNVIGIDRFHPPHKNGSHSGQTRIIRKAYFEHPDYVPLLEEAYAGWKELEEYSGAIKLHQVGFLYMGKPGNPVMKGVEQSAEKYRLPLKYFNHQEFKMTYPYFDKPENFLAFSEEAAGYVKPEESIRDYLKLATQNGARLLFNSPVQNIESKENHVVIQTGNNLLKAKKVIVTVGAYIKELWPKFPLKLSITRQLISWWEVEKANRFTEPDFPCWTIIHEDYPGIFYGFPIMKEDSFENPLMFKMAHHHPGIQIKPDEIHQFDYSKEENKLSRILHTYMPNLKPKLKAMTACLYTNSPDEHFIIDFLPESKKKIILATGFSGHGFKFIPVVGKVLRDLVEKEKTDYPIGLFSLGRFFNTGDTEKK